MLQNILRFVGNCAGIGFFALLCYAALQSYRQTSSWLSFNIVLVNGLMLVLYLLRRGPKRLTDSPGAWAISLVAVVMPFAFRPAQAALLPGLLSLGYCLQILGLLAMLLALLSLRGSVGIVPADRGIKMGECYRWVRHPLYAAELLFFTGYVLSNPSLFNLVWLMLVYAIQYCRSRIEEHFLSGDPDYRQYFSRTRYRFIPGLL